MTSIISIFEEYGWFGIATIVVLGVIFTILQYFQNSMSSNLEKIGDRLTQHISDQNKDLTSKILDQNDRIIDNIISINAEKKHTHDAIIKEKLDTSIDLDIHDYLKNIGLYEHSHHVYILEFHNHDMNLTGTPFIKFTCKYEWLSIGHETIVGSCKDLPFSILANIINDIRQSSDSYVLYNNINNFKNESTSLYSFIKDNSTKSYVFKGIYNNDKGILMGLLVIEYDNKISQNSLNINQINIRAAELAQLVNLRYKYVQ